MVVIVSPELARHFGSAGWSKGRIREFLAKIQHEEVSNWIEREEKAGRDVSESAEPVSGAVRKPENISVIVAGGKAGAFCALVPLVEMLPEGKVIIKPIGDGNNRARI